MDYLNSDKLLFIVASAGGGGHRLGRIVSCIDNVYWYSSVAHNGIEPWDLPVGNLVKGREVSQHHFDRRTKFNMVPLVGERVERFWDNNDYQTFYTDVWPAGMDLARADDIINNGQYVLWVVHDTPQYILSRFPNAKIINLVDVDVDKTVERYIATTAFFPVVIENTKIKPDYVNAYAAELESLIKQNATPTYRDYWAWAQHREPVFSSKHDAEYYSYVYKMLTIQHAERVKENPKYFTVTWDSLDVTKIIEYLGASSINKNYLKI